MFRKESLPHVTPATGNQNQTGTMHFYSRINHPIKKPDLREYRDQAYLIIDKCKANLSFPNWGFTPREANLFPESPIGHTIIAIALDT